MIEEVIDFFFFFLGKYVIANVILKTSRRNEISELRVLRTKLKHISMFIMKLDKINLNFIFIISCTYDRREFLFIIVMYDTKKKKISHITCFNQLASISMINDHLNLKLIIDRIDIYSFIYPRERNFAIKILRSGF